MATLNSGGSREEKRAAASARVQIDNVVPLNGTINPLLNFALEYAERGWWVFPLRFGVKISHKSAEHSDGRRWGMTTDPDEILLDAKRWPDANIGIAMGAEIGAFVMETDTMEGHDVDGGASLAELETEHGALPETRQAISPSGSIHYYFNHPGFKVKNSVSVIGLGIDIKGDGGMVVAPPSVVPPKAAKGDKPARPGGVYRWLNDLPNADAPQWLLDRILAGKETPEPENDTQQAGAEFDAIYGGRQQKYAAISMDRMIAELAGKVPGSRNATLNATTFKLGQMSVRLWIDEAIPLRRIRQACVTNGLVEDTSEQAVEATIASGLGDGRANPHPDLPAHNAEPNGPDTSKSGQRKIKGWPRRRARDFRDTISKDWIMKGVVAPGEVSNFCGLPKSGKSGLVEDLCLHIVAGRDWRGYRSKKQGGIIYFALERADLVERRWNVQARLYDLDPQSLPFHIVSLTIDMMDKHCVDMFVATIREAEADDGGPIVMIVIDTGSKAMAAGGGEENSAKDKNMMRANARRVMDAVEGLHVCFVNHTGKDEAKRERGSNAGEGDDDVLIMLNGATAVVEKRNDGPTGLLTPYSMKPVILGVDDDGDQVDIAIIDPDTTAPSKENHGNKVKLTPQQMLAMELLVNCVNDVGIPPPPSLKLPKSVNRTVTLEQWRGYCVKGGLGGGDRASSRKAFTRAVEHLRAFHKIGIDDQLCWIAYE